MSIDINKNTQIGPSFSLKNRAMRVLWLLIHFLFFKYSPAPFFWWRGFLLRIFGARIAISVHVYPDVKIWAPWNLTLNKGCGIANGVILYSQDKIYIGEWAVVSQGVHLCGGTHDYEKSGFPLLTSPIYIGAHAWVAAEAFIHPGVTIGQGAVVGARSVVTKDVAPWTVNAGHPCRELKMRMWRPTQI